MNHRIHWSLYFSIWVAGIILLGAVIGALVFPVGGMILESPKTLAQLAWKGVRFMSFYFMIWAPGIALVATVARAYRLHQAAAPGETPSARVGK